MIPFSNDTKITPIHGNDKLIQRESDLVGDEPIKDDATKHLDANSGEEDIKSNNVVGRAIM